MFGVRAAAILVCGAFWACALTPAAAITLTCDDAIETFSSASAEHARNAPEQFASEDAKSAEDKQRNHAGAIARARANFDAAAASSGADSLEAASARIKLASAMRPAAQLKPALAQLSAAEAVLLKLAPEGVEMAMLLRERGITLSNMRRREEAVIALNAAVKLYAEGEARDSGLEALNSQTLSDVLRGLSRFNEALGALNRAQAIYDRDPDANAQYLVYVLINKFIILTRLDDRTSELAVIGRAVELAQERLGPYHRSTARAFHNQAIGYRRVGAMRESFTALGKAHAIYSTQGSMVRASEALDDVARTLTRIGCLPGAIAYQI